MAKRFYQAQFPGGRPVFLEDFGNLLTLSGLVFDGMGKTLVVHTQDSRVVEHNYPVIHYQPSPEEWAAILAESDDPKILELDDGYNVKAFHRKVRYQIGGHIQQKVWVRDGLQCVFCGRVMGEVQLTVDHWMPLELGGVNDTTNYVSACRACNKDKGSKHPRDFCNENGYRFGVIDSLAKSGVR
jgi:hypothetical protein